MNIFLKKRNLGTHILGEIYSENKSRLTDVVGAKKYITKLIKQYGLSELGGYYHQFPDDGGFTCIVSLTESHVAIHTWPEYNYLTADIYLCNYSRDNRKICKSFFISLSNYFDASKVRKKIIIR